MNSKEKTQLQKEIVDSLEPNPHGRLILAPRVGKTKIGIDIIKRDKPDSILWVTPSAELADKDIPLEFEKWKAKRFIKKLTTSTWMSLDKVEGHFDMIILDEEQFMTENNYINLYLKKITYNSLISMTGTKTKHENKQQLYKNLSLRILYDISINDAVDIGLLSNYTMKILEVSMSSEKNIQAGNKQKQWMTNEISQYSYLDNIAKQAIYQKRRDVSFRIMERMRFIKNAPSKHNAAEWLFNNLEGRKLMFCASIDQAEQLCSHTYHSKTDNKDLVAFKNGNIDEITMVNAGGVGQTYKAIDHLILVQADSDKNGLTSQKICRTLLQQKDYHAVIWIISLIGTQDEKWVESTLESFDKTKVEFVRFKNLINQQDFSSPESLDMFRKNGVTNIQVGSKNYKL